MLTLALVMRQGDFWASVWFMRYRWSIDARAATTADVSIEPHQDAEGEWLFGLTPPSWPDSYKEFAPTELSDREDPTVLTTVDVERAGRSWDEWSSICERQWQTDLGRLYAAAVPASCTQQGGPGQLLWYPFLSLCILFDPPPDNLQWFAHAVPWEFLGTYAADRDDPEPYDIADSAVPFMSAPPIVHMQDTNLVGFALSNWFDALIQAASNDDEILEAGIDLQAVIGRTLVGQPGMHATVDAVEHRRVIEVTPDTTDEDVRNAARLIRATFPKRPKAGRPKRDSLTCVQAAIWYDEYGRSQERIGRHFGWTVQELDYAKNRCETARQHIAEGRDFLKQRNPAA